MIHINQTLKKRVAGVLFIALSLGGLLFTVLIYNKALPWQSVKYVTLIAPRSGTQLTPPADVKIRGLIIGEVRGLSVRKDGTVAFKLAIQPSQLDKVPSDVKARVLPKTLFGEKYVDLVAPDGSIAKGGDAKDHLQAGATIGEDRSAVAIEIYRVFDDLLPLLRTLQPEKLNATLSALATALQDRGNALGDNFQVTDTYLKGFNPSIPALQQDISGLADLASSLNDAAPDLIRLLANQGFTSQTLAAKADTLASFLKGTAGFADTATAVVTENEDNLIRLPQVSRPVLNVFAAYSSEFPCLFRGLTDQNVRSSATFDKGVGLHIHLEIVESRGAYIPGADDPNYSRNIGKASCAGLPYPGDVAHYPGIPGATDIQSSGFRDIGPVGSSGEKALLNAIVAPVLGVAPGAMGDTPDLLLGPMLRGTSVVIQ